MSQGVGAQIIGLVNKVIVRGLVKSVGQKMLVKVSRECQSGLTIALTKAGRIGSKWTEVSSTKILAIK